MDAEEPRWLTFDEVCAIHDFQLLRHGGKSGFTDAGLVKSAINNPINLYHYDGENDLVTLAARLCKAIAKNHGFVDGNKRTGYGALHAFLELNGYTIIAPNDLALAYIVEGIVDGYRTEEELADSIAPLLFEKPDDEDDMDCGDDGSAMTVDAPES